jgi:hypothetical protein
MAPMTYDELQRQFPPGRLITGHDRRWSVRIPLGRDAAGKLLHHWKSLHGSKADAQRYADWINGLLSSGQTIPATVAQWELRELAALQAKADKLRATSQAAVRDGASVEPGALELPAAGAVLPEKRKPRATPKSNLGLFRPLFQ